jgi:ATP-dependent Clp protease ATP-binding subunit ClpA
MATVSEILHAIELVDDALAMVDMALNSNPNPDQERALRRQRLRLEAERAVLEAELDAALDSSSSAQGPNAAQLAEIVALVEAVETATNQQAAISNVLSLGSQALGLITDVVKN